MPAGVGLSSRGLIAELGSWWGQLTRCGDVRGPRRRSYSATCRGPLETLDKLSKELKDAPPHSSPSCLSFPFASCYSYLRTTLRSVLKSRFRNSWEPEKNEHHSENFKMAKNDKDPEIINLAKTLQGIPWCEEYEKMISGMM